MPTVTLSITEPDGGKYDYVYEATPAVEPQIVPMTDASPVITFAPQKTAPINDFVPLQIKATSTYKDAPVILELSYGLSYASLSSSNVLSFTGKGMAIILATQKINGVLVATKTQRITVNSIRPVITFKPQPSSVSNGSGGFAPLQISATSTNTKGVITYALSTSLPNIASLSPSNVLTITGAGTVTITASQAARGIFTKALSATQTINAVVIPSQPVITFKEQPSTVNGPGFAPLQISATSTNTYMPITFALITSVPNMASLSPNNVLTMTAAGTVTITATQAAYRMFSQGSATQTIVVVDKRQTPKITFKNFDWVLWAPSLTFNTSFLSELALKAESTNVTGPPIVFRISSFTRSISGIGNGDERTPFIVNGNILRVRERGIVSVTATQDEDTFYTSGSATQKIEVITTEELLKGAYPQPPIDYQ